MCSGNHARLPDCDSTETLEFAQAQKKQKVLKATEIQTKSHALKEKRAENVVQRKADGETLLAVAKGPSGNAWKTVCKADVILGAYRAWGGHMSALADSKKATVALALEPLLAIKMNGGTVQEEKEEEEEKNDEGDEDE